MKLPSPCMAKESGHPSGGKADRSASASGSGLSDAEASFSEDVEQCPCGVAVTVRSETGEQVTAIRHAYQPHWFNEDRSGGIPFVPVAWKPIVG